MQNAPADLMKSEGQDRLGCVLAKSGNRLKWHEAAAAKQVFVLVCGAMLAAGVIWALPAMPRWAIAATVWTMVLLLLVACGLYWRSKRTWW